MPALGKLKAASGYCKPGKFGKVCDPGFIYWYGNTFCRAKVHVQKDRINAAAYQEKAKCPY